MAEKTTRRGLFGMVAAVALAPILQRERVSELDSITLRNDGPTYAVEFEADGKVHTFTGVQFTGATVRHQGGA